MIYTSTPKASIGSTIENNLLHEQNLKYEIKKLKVYLSALEEQTLRYIKKLNCGIYFDRESMWKAWMYFSSKKKKKDELNDKDKEDIREYKDFYKFVESRINWEFVPDNYKINITNFIMVGLNEYGYEITFDIWKDNDKPNKKEFKIQIPIVENIDSENIEYALHGKYRLGYQKGICNEFILASYNEKDIKNKLFELMETK